MIKLIKTNDSNYIFSILGLISCLIFYYFSIENDLGYKAFVLSLGLYFFIININIFKIEYIQVISSILIFISLINYWFFIISCFIGYILFILVIVKSDHRLRNLFFSVLFCVIYIFNFSFDGEGNIHYLKDLLTIKTKDIDLYFHSSIASNYKIQNNCTTGVHGFYNFQYWDLSNRFAANLGAYLGIRCIDFYCFLYPLFIIPVLLKFSHELISKYIIRYNLKPSSNQNLLITFSLLVSLSFLTIHPYFGPTLFFFKWECHRTFNLLLAIVITFKFILVLYELILNKNIRTSNFLLFTSSLFFLYCITNFKFYFLYFALLSTFILCFTHTSKEIALKLRFLFLSCILVFIYFLIFQNSNAQSILQIDPFSIWKLNTNNQHILWSPFSLGLPLVLLIFLNQNNIYFRDFLCLNKIRRPSNISIIILFSLLFLSLIPTFVYGGPLVWNTLYPINTYYFFLSVPLSIVIIVHLNSLNFRNPTLTNVITLLFLTIAVLNSTGTGLLNFYNKFNHHNEFNKYLTDNSLKYEKLMKLDETLNKLSKAKQPNSALWIPKYNEEVWELLAIKPYALPFVFSSLSELPLLYGFPDIPDYAFNKIGYGYSAFDIIPRNLDSNLSKTLIESKNLGFDYIYVLDGYDKIILHEI